MTPFDKPGALRRVEGRGLLYLVTTPMYNTIRRIGVIG